MEQNNNELLDWLTLLAKEVLYFPNHILSGRIRAQLYGDMPHLSLDHVDKILQFQPSDYDARIFKAHVLAAHDENDKARQLLQQLEDTGLPHLGYYFNLAEAYLVVDPSEAIRILEQYKGNSREDTAMYCMLRVLALELLGNSDMTLAAWKECTTRAAEIGKTGWVFFELSQYPEWAIERQSLDKIRAESLRRSIAFFEDISTIRTARFLRNNRSLFSEGHLV